MTDRERLLKILDEPIFPRENIDPLIAVADYLMDNDVLPVVRCKDCEYSDSIISKPDRMICRMHGLDHCFSVDGNDFCSFGERISEDTATK